MAELKRRLEAEGRPVPGKPSQTTLYDDLTEISGASANEDQENSG